ncbi:hypothetical protein [Cellulosimicrobium sp. NPDC057127]|uniref:hypothetical protein n=1 Tax=Cellulosimicrobium sp. NPDC057127 TaxID=3346026 RepID=UPI00362D9880
MTDVPRPGEARPRADDARFRPGARRGRVAWPAYGDDAGPDADPLRRTLDADLHAQGEGEREGRQSDGTRSEARRARTGAADATGAARAAAGTGAGQASRATDRRTVRPPGFWTSLRPGVLVGGGVVAVVLVLARAATGLDGESTVVVAPYGTTLVVTPLLALVCATGWAVHARRRRAARGGGEDLPVPRAWLRRTTTTLGVTLAVLVVTPLWVGFSA